MIFQSPLMAKTSSTNFTYVPSFLMERFNMGF
jgi:hypothetical protein